MPLDADIYGHHEPVAASLLVSTALHAALAAAIIFLPALLTRDGNDWGNNGNGNASGDSAMSATLVSGIPLPPNPQAKPEQVLANDSKGLSESTPAPKAAEDDKAIAIPDKDTKLKPTKEKAPTAQPSRSQPVPQQKQQIAAPSREKPREMAKADNTVPFGAGGPMAGPFTSFQSGNTSGGMKFGDGGTGGFGSRYGWYADAVSRKVRQYWQNEVNPSVSSAKRVYIVFDISRDGTPSHVRVEQSSGIPSLDISAVRTLQRIDTFGALPGDYRGSSISVEFWFDYNRH